MQIKFFFIFIFFNSFLIFSKNINYVDTNSLKLRDIYCIVDSVFCKSKGYNFYSKKRGLIKLTLIITIDSCGRVSNCSYYSKTKEYQKEFVTICDVLEDRNVSYFLNMFLGKEYFEEKKSFFIVFNNRLFEMCQYDNG